MEASPSHQMHETLPGPIKLPIKAPAKIAVFFERAQGSVVSHCQLFLDNLRSFSALNLHAL